MSISLKFFLWWHHKLFKHTLRKQEETECFDFRPCAEGDLGEGSETKVSLIYSHHSKTHVFQASPYDTRGPVPLGNLHCVKLAENRLLWLCLSAQCKLRPWATNQSQGLLCDVWEFLQTLSVYDRCPTWMYIPEIVHWYLQHDSMVIWTSTFSVFSHVFTSTTCIQPLILTTYKREHHSHVYINCSYIMY